jgi:hypothetical protein
VKVKLQKVFWIKLLGCIFRLSKVLQEAGYTILESCNRTTQRNLNARVDQLKLQDQLATPGSNLLLSPSERDAWVHAKSNQYDVLRPNHLIAIREVVEGKSKGQITVTNGSIKRIREQNYSSIAEEQKKKLRPFNTPKAFTFNYTDIYRYYY